MDLARLVTFAGLWFALGLSPGPNAAFCIATGLLHRFREAMAAPIGFGVASFVHVTIAAVGVSAIFARSPTAFQTLRFAGASYLAWLGIKQWRSASSILDITARGNTGSRAFKLLRRAIVVSLTNPKAILQYVAVLPQFIDTKSPAALQFVALALIAAPVVIADYAIYTAAAAGIARRLTATRTLALHRATAAIYILAAVVLAAK